MRIAIIGSGGIEVPKIGGSIRNYAYRPVKGLCDSGHEVHFFDSKHLRLTTQYQNLHVHKVRHLDFRFLSASNNFMLTVIGLHFTMLAYSASCLFHLWGILRGNEIDIIQVNTRYDAVTVMLLQRLISSHIPVIFTCHNSDWQREKLPLILRILFLPEVFAIKNATAVIAVSQTLRDNIVRKMSVNPEKVRVVYPKVDRDLFQLTVRDESTGAPCLVCVSDLIDRKNQLVLVKAMPSVVKRFPGCELVLIGGMPDKSYLAKIRSTAEQLGISESIKIEGKVPHKELPDWLHRADVCLVPTQREASPSLVLLEALSCKKAVVASEIPELTELNGIIGQDVFATASPFKPEEWAARIVEILEDAKRRHEYEENASKLISSLKEEAQQYIDVYEVLVK